MSFQHISDGTDEIDEILAHPRIRKPVLYTSLSANIAPVTS